jgi:hypothetical protein
MVLSYRDSGVIAITGVTAHSDPKYSVYDLIGWRCGTVDLPIESVVEELETARKFQRRFVNRVHRL